MARPTPSRPRLEPLEDRLALSALAITDVSHREGGLAVGRGRPVPEIREFNFRVTLDSPSHKKVRVNYATADGSATAASGDYIATSGTLTFAPGQTRQTVTVRVRGDTRIEPNETFRVLLSNPTNATIADGVGVGTIRDDDGGRGRASMTLLASGLEDPSGSTVGPDGYLYVAEGGAGRVARIDPKTGDVTTFVSGLPISPIPGFGVGVVDVAFLGRTAYVLVNLVGPDVGGSDVVGIYRVDGPTSFTVVADLGAWAVENPPDTEFEVPSGAPFAMEPYRGGFLVTEGHHNRVLHVTPDGGITEVIAFGNIVPTGLAVRGNKVYMAQAGPTPHLPEDGKIVSFRRRSAAAKEVASGAPLLVDVEFGRGDSLYALSQGEWDGVFPGDPALPDTGSLVKVNRDGTFTVVEDDLDQPSSLEFIKDTAYVVTLTGEVWKIDDVSGPRHGGRAAANGFSDVVPHQAGGGDGLAALAQFLADSDVKRRRPM